MVKIMILRKELKIVTKFWNMSSSLTDSNILNIYVYGDIVTDSCWFWGSEDDVVAREFIKDLHAHPNVTRINVYINSGGGEVFAAITMAQQLKQHKAEVHTYVEGMCASAATLIAMAGDVRHMSVSGLFMIHLPSGRFTGNRMDLDKGKEVLSKVEEVIKLTYQEKVNLSDEKLTEMLEHETWLTAEEALQYNFITDIERDSVDTIDNLISDLQNDIIAMNGVQINISAYTEQAQLRAKLAELKSKQKGGEIMDFQEFLNTLAPDKRALVEQRIKDQVSTQLSVQTQTLTDQVQQVTTQLKEVQDKLSASEKALAESKAEVIRLQNTTEDEDTKFLNSLPENARQAVLASRKALAAAEAEKQRLLDEKEYATFINSLATYGNLPLQEEHKAALFNISKNNPEEYVKLEALFKVANATMQQNFQAIGTDNDNHIATDSAWEQLSNAIANKQKINPLLSYNDAFTEVVRENPALYEAYRDSQC